MFNWNDADQSDLQLLNVIKFLFGRKKFLLECLFMPSKPRLHSSSILILKNIRGFSESEQTLIKIALDIWDGSGGATFNEIKSNLDQNYFERFVEAAKIIRNNSLNFHISGDDI